MNYQGTDVGRGLTFKSGADMAAVTNRSFIEKMHRTIFSRKNAFDSFETLIIQSVIDQLDLDDAHILRAQVDLLNSTRRDYDEDKKKLVVYFYWKYFGKPRTDFPLKWEASEKERKLARVHIAYGNDISITTDLFVVLGCFFYIEFSSNKEEFRPPSPNFVIKDVEVFKV